MIEMFQTFRCFAFPVRCGQTTRTHELLYLSVAVLCHSVVFIAKVVNSRVLLIKVMCCCYCTLLLLYLNLNHYLKFKM